MTDSDDRLEWLTRVADKDSTLARAGSRRCRALAPASDRAGAGRHVDRAGAGRPGWPLLDARASPAGSSLSRRDGPCRRQGRDRGRGRGARESWRVRGGAAAGGGDAARVARGWPTRCTGCCQAAPWPRIERSGLCSPSSRRRAGPLPRPHRLRHTGPARGPRVGRRPGGWASPRPNRRWRDGHKAERPHVRRGGCLVAVVPSRLNVQVPG